MVDTMSLVAKPKNNTPTELIPKAESIRCLEKKYASFVPAKIRLLR